MKGGSRERQVRMGQRVPKASLAVTGREEHLVPRGSKASLAVTGRKELRVLRVLRVTEATPV